MKEQIKNALTAAGDYLDDHGLEIYIRSMFSHDQAMVTAVKLRWLYKALKASYQKAAEKNALTQSKKPAISDK